MDCSIFSPLVQNKTNVALPAAMVTRETSRLLDRYVKTVRPIRKQELEN